MCACVRVCREREIERERDTWSVSSPRTHKLPNIDTAIEAKPNMTMSPRKTSVSIFPLATESAPAIVGANFKRRAVASSRALRC